MQQNCELVIFEAVVIEIELFKTKVLTAAQSLEHLCECDRCLLVDIVADQRAPAIVDFREDWARSNLALLAGLIEVAHGVTLNGACLCCGFLRNIVELGLDLTLLEYLSSRQLLHYLQT